MLYPQEEIARWDREEVKYATGLVPLYLKQWAKDPKDYYRQVPKEIQSSLVKLRREQRDVWNIFVQSTIQCLLRFPSTEMPEFLDRKYLLVNIDTKTDKCCIVALFPLMER